MCSAASSLIQHCITVHRDASGMVRASTARVVSKAQRRRRLRHRGGPAVPGLFASPFATPYRRLGAGT